MAEFAFSEDGKYYSAISSDGRLKIWDTETSALKQEYTPNLHLVSPPTCLQWITVSHNAGRAQKQANIHASVRESEAQCIALGTSKGKILIYSVARGKIEVELQNRSSSKVTAIDWHRKYGLISCCGKEGVAVEWNLQKAHERNSYKVSIGSKSKQGNVISAIKIIPHNLEIQACYLVTASWQVHLWRLYAGEATVIKSFGHNASQTAVLSLATLNNRSWLIEGSQNERLLSFWDVTIKDDFTPAPQVNGDSTPTKKKRKKSFDPNKSSDEAVVVANASYNFVLEDAPRTVDVDLKEEDGAMKLNLAATTRSGVVHYYGHMLNGSSAKPLKPSVTLQATTPEATPLALQCCRLQPEGLLLAYWQGPLLIFDTVVPELKSKTQVLIRGESKQLKKYKQHQSNEINKVRSDFNSNDAAVVEPMGGVSSRKRVAPGAQIEVPMEVRLANLSLGGLKTKDSPVNQNVSKLLAQGLQSKDESILKMVLRSTREVVAKRTVGALPMDCIPLLLEQLVEMATKKTAVCEAVCVWLQAVTVRHSALLLAMSHTHGDQLARLTAVFTHRRSHLCQLLNLKGRVELTVNQRTVTEERKEQAVLEYNDDTSSEEEEMQIEKKKYKSDSEESWGDNQFDSADDDDDKDDDDNKDYDSEDMEEDASSSGND